MIATAPWPAYDESKMVESEKEIAVQVNGKFKTTVVIPVDADDETVLGIVKENEKIKGLIAGMDIVRTIVVKNKLVNIIIKPSK